MRWSTHLSLSTVFKGYPLVSVPYRPCAAKAVDLFPLHCTEHQSQEEQDPHSVRGDSSFLVSRGTWRSPLSSQQRPAPTKPPDIFITPDTWARWALRRLPEADLILTGDSRGPQPLREVNHPTISSGHPLFFLYHSYTVPPFTLISCFQCLGSW